MTQPSAKVIFFGNERLSTGFTLHGAPTLSALIAAGYDVVAVVSHFTAGTSRKKRTLEIEEVAAAHNIPVLLPQKMADIKQQLADFKADVGVLVAFGKIVPQDIIDIFPKGIVNIHPSLLPLYRGSTPIEQAMLDSAPQTGVSLMSLAKQMDAGPVYAQTTVPLTGAETKQALTEKLLTIGGDMLITHLPAILDGSLTPVSQDEADATYCRLLQKSDGQLDTTKPADRLAREVRAYANWPKSTIELFGHRVIVTQAIAHATMPPNAHALLVTCGNATVLEITEIIAPSGRRMSGADFLRGYKK